jgi:hypothetical protein
MLHVCGVVVIILLDHKLLSMCGKNEEFLPFYGLRGLESSPNILITMNPSLEFG